MSTTEKAPWTVVAASSPDLRKKLPFALGVGMEALGQLGLGEDAMSRAVCVLLRDLFSPFYTLPTGRWPSEIVHLAADCYDSLPSHCGPWDLLADLLREIDHGAAELCRGGPHYRGFWVLDAILGKE
jgi:hypothetical protein